MVYAQVQSDSLNLLKSAQEFLVKTDEKLMIQRPNKRIELNPNQRVVFNKKEMLMEKKLPNILRCSASQNICPSLFSKTNL